jgi:hypothetical protein
MFHEKVEENNVEQSFFTYSEISDWSTFLNLLKLLKKLFLGFKFLLKKTSPPPSFRT